MLFNCEPWEQTQPDFGMEILAVVYAYFLKYQSADKLLRLSKP